MVSFSQVLLEQNTARIIDREFGTHYDLIITAFQTGQILLFLVILFIPMNEMKVGLSYHINRIHQSKLMSNEKKL